MLQQPAAAASGGVGLNEKVWLKVPLGMECVAKVELSRMNHFKVSETIHPCKNLI